MLRPPAGSCSPTPMKSGIAIGTGWTLPWVTSSLSTAAACRGDRAANAPAVAPAPSARSRRRLRCGKVDDELRSIGTSGYATSLTSTAEHVAGIERDLDVFPLF